MPVWPSRQSQWKVVLSWCWHDPPPILVQRVIRISACQKPGDALQHLVIAAPSPCLSLRGPGGGLAPFPLCCHPVHPRSGVGLWQGGDGCSGTQGSPRPRGLWVCLWCVSSSRPCPACAPLPPLLLSSPCSAPAAKTCPGCAALAGGWGNSHLDLSLKLTFHVGLHLPQTSKNNFSWSSSFHSLILTRSSVPGHWSGNWSGHVPVQKEASFMDGASIKLLLIAGLEREKGNKKWIWTESCPEQESQLPQNVPDIQ